MIVELISPDPRWTPRPRRRLPIPRRTWRLHYAYHHHGFFPGKPAVCISMAEKANNTTRDDTVDRPALILLFIYGFILLFLGILGRVLRVFGHTLFRLRPWRNAGQYRGCNIRERLYESRSRSFRTGLLMSAEELLFSVCAPPQSFIEVLTLINRNTFPI